jgi:TolB protein
MSFDDDFIPTEDAQPRRRPSCLIVSISAIIIISLLAASVASLVWFVREQFTQESGTPTPIYHQQAEETVAEPTVPEQNQDIPLIEETSEPDELQAPALAQSQLNRIVLVNSERQIETVAPDGSQRRLLTNDEHLYEYPAWSPDGSQIAALGADRQGGGIYLLQDAASSGPEKEIYFSSTRRPFYLYWSPDSRQISFLANNPTQGISLNLVPAKTGQESREIALGSPFYWNWSADSEQLLIHSGDQDDGSRLVMIDSSGTDQKPQIPSPGFFQAPGISPSGRFWAYAQLKEGGLSWITVDDQISGEQTAERHAGAIALNWSPVADQLAFISGSDESDLNFWGPLRLFDAETGETRLLSSNFVLAFFWSPDGKKILTISLPNNGGLDGAIEVREPKSRHVARLKQALPPSQRSPHQFKLSVINIADGTGLELAEVILSPSYLSSFLVYFDQYALSHTIWSPDSRFVVLPIIAAGDNQIVVFSTESGRQQQIGSGEIAFWSKQ